MDEKLLGPEAYDGVSRGVNTKLKEMLGQGAEDGMRYFFTLKQQR